MANLRTKRRAATSAKSERRPRPRRIDRRQALTAIPRIYGALRRAKIAPGKLRTFWLSLQIFRAWCAGGATPPILRAAP